MNVDDYIAKQESPQKEIVKRLRRIILKTFPDIKEEYKMGVPFYENKYYIVALKDSVNLGFSIKGLTREQQKLFQGQGKLMKHLKFFSYEEINEEEIVRLLKMVE